MACVKNSQLRNDPDSRKSSQSPELMRFLESTASYPHGPPAVRSIQTHISWVFVASPFVFKVKKPANLGFADFSTLERRRHFCQREVELNRRLCPEVYLGVVPIFKTASGFSFNGEGEIAEYCVQMKELSRGWFLSELLTRIWSARRKLIGCFLVSIAFTSHSPRVRILTYGGLLKT